VDGFGAELRRKGGRAIVRQRQAVDDVLCLILGASRVEYAVGFEQPPRLRVDEIEQRPARQRGRALLDRLGADAVLGRRLPPIQQRVGRRDRHLRLDRGKAQHDRILGGQSRSDLNQAGETSEPRPDDRDAVGPEWQPLGHEHAAAVGREFLLDAIRLADKLDGPRQRESRPIGHRQPQLTGVALAELAKQE
jgi:hypothetical protein